jgi:uncharacterized protein YggU (UPF0235/DUF167 family)
MRIVVKAKASAKEEKVERLKDQTLNLPGIKIEPEVYRVWVREAPIEGQANLAIVKALAKYFGVSRSKIRLISGKTSKQKVFEIG